MVIPVLNEAATIETTLAALQKIPGLSELIVVDGGSCDQTVARASRPGVRVLTSVRGRGVQMHAGALSATGDVIWFLHADTLPPEDAARHIAEAVVNPSNVAGNFEVLFEGKFLSARFLTLLYHYLALLGLRYGDSAYFVKREEYIAVGGFRPFPIFEDLDLMRRLKKRGRFVRVRAVVTTSSRRFRGRSFLLIFARWAVLQILYWIGISPNVLGRFYWQTRLPALKRSKHAPAAREVDRGSVAI